MIPIFDSQGTSSGRRNGSAVIGFGARILKQVPPKNQSQTHSSGPGPKARAKYMNSPDTAVFQKVRYGVVLLCCYVAVLLCCYVAVLLCCIQSKPCDDASYMELILLYSRVMDCGASG